MAEASNTPKPKAARKPAAKTSATGAAPKAANACCGGPAPEEADACCVQDVVAKADGKSGCGCGTSVPADDQSSKQGADAFA